MKPHQTAFGRFFFGQIPVTVTGKGGLPPVGQQETMKPHPVHITKGAHMPNIKQVLTLAVPVAILVAVIFRVAPVRKVVVGG
ncbi:hypothetical protein [Vogesella indigofera]|nr:hypothetical protein [Vogesella indigofera]